MVKLKYDVSDVDASESREVVSGLADSPKPGLHRFRIKEVDAGFSKGDDGKPDQSKPRVEVVLECQSPAHRGAHVWAYFLQPGHEKYNKRDAAKWDQLLQALGISSERKRTGTIDTDKQMVGKFIVVNIKQGKDRAGDYRGEYAQAFPDGHEGVSDGDSDDEELIDEGDEDVTDDDVMDDEVDWDARAAELKAMAADELKSIAKEWKEAGWDITIGGTKSELVDKIVAVEQAASEIEEGSEEEVSDDDDVIDDDEIVEDEDTSEFLTREQLQAMETSELVATAKDFDIATKGKKKSEVIEEIITAQAAPGDVDDDELPF
jgi:hypothetical protein